MSSERFQWHPASVVYGRRFELMIDDVGSGPPNATIAKTGQLGECRIAANSGRPETLLSIFQAIAVGMEFAVMPPRHARNPAGNDSVSAGLPGATLPVPDNVFQVCSGGSMGPVRRIRRTHSSWLASFEINRSLFSLGAKDSYAVLGELHHSLAFYAALEALHIGADLHLLARQKADRQLARLAANEVSVVYATPAQLRLLATVARRKSCMASSVRLVLIGGAPLDKRTALGVRKLFPGSMLRRFYGTSETSYIAIDDGSTLFGSTGLLYPGVDVVLRDESDAEESGDCGVIWARSPYLCLGRGWPEFRRLHDESGFVSTGDIGRWRANGRLEVLGRNDRLFKVADVTVYPEQIENCICSLPGVESAAAFPIGDDMKGNVVGARVSIGNNGPTVDEILLHCRTRLGGLMAPKRIEVDTRTPQLTASGKVQFAAHSVARQREGQ